MVTVKLRRVILLLQHSSYHYGLLRPLYQWGQSLPISTNSRNGSGFTSEVTLAEHGTRPTCWRACLINQILPIFQAGLIGHCRIRCIRVAKHPVLHAMCHLARRNDHETMVRLFSILARDDPDAAFSCTADWGIKRDCCGLLCEPVKQRVVASLHLCPRAVLCAQAITPAVIRQGTSTHTPADKIAA